MVDVDQPGTVLVHPHRRGTIAPEQRHHAREMLEHATALGIGRVQREGAAQPLIAANAQLVES